MEKLILEIPDDMAGELHHYEDRLREIIALGLMQMKVQEALALYSRGVASLERAAEMAGISRREMVRQANAYGIEPRWSEEMAQAEMA